MAWSAYTFTDTQSGLVVEKRNTNDNPHNNFFWYRVRGETEWFSSCEEAVGAAVAARAVESPAP